MIKPKLNPFFLLFLILNLVPVIKSHAQTDFRPGYYITWDNDTVYGLIDFRGEIRNSKLCEFRKNESSETRRLEPSDIQAYRFADDKYYISKEINMKDGNKTVFVEFLINGIVDLYFYRDLNHYMYFIEGEDGRLHELANVPQNEESTINRNPNRHIGVLKAILADCEEIQADIERVDLNHKSLIGITKEYHDIMCENESCLIYEKQPEKIQIRIAPTIGGGLAKLHFDKGFFSHYTFERNSFPLAGILFNISFPGWNRKLSLDLEADFFKTNNEGSYISGNGFVTDYYNASINITSFQPSLALKYTFLNGKIKPTLAAGLYSNFFILKDEKIIKKSVHTDAEYIAELDETPLSSGVYGVLLQIGCDYNTKNNHTFFTHLRVYQTAFKEAGVSTFLNTVNFGLGMYINKSK